MHSPGRFGAAAISNAHDVATGSDVLDMKIGCSTRPAQRRVKSIELLADIGRFLLVAFLLTAVLATAWWPSPTRRTLATPPDDGSWLPGDV